MATATEFVYGKKALEGRKQFDPTAYGGKTHKKKSKDQSPSSPSGSPSGSPSAPSAKQSARSSPPSSPSSQSSPSAPSSGSKAGTSSLPSRAPAARPPQRHRPHAPDTGAHVEKSKDLDPPTKPATKIPDTWNKDHPRLHVDWRHDPSDQAVPESSGPKAPVPKATTVTTRPRPPQKAAATTATTKPCKRWGNKKATGLTFADTLPAFAPGTEDLPEWTVDPLLHAEYEQKYETAPPMRAKKIPQGGGIPQIITYTSIPDIPGHVMEMAKRARAQAREPTDMKSMRISVRGYYTRDEVTRESDRYEVMKLPVVFPDTTAEQLEEIKKRYAEAGQELLFTNRLVAGKETPVQKADASLEQDEPVNLFTIFAIAELRDLVMERGSLSHRDARHLSQTCHSMAMCMSQSFDCWNANKWWGGEEKKLLLGKPRPFGPLVITRGSSKYAGLPAERCVDQDEVDWKAINAGLTEEERKVVKPINPDFPSVGPFFQNSLNTTFNILHKLTTVFKNRTCVVLPPLEIFNFGLLRILLNECPELRQITIAGCAQCNLMGMENYVKLCMDFPKVKIDWTPYVWNGPSTTDRLGSFGITFNKPYFDTCAAMSAMLFRCYPFAKKIGLNLFGGSILHALKQLPFPKFWWMRLHVALDQFFDPDHIAQGEWFYYKPWKALNEGVARAMAGDNDEVYTAYLAIGGENNHWGECVLCLTSNCMAGDSPSHLPSTLTGAVPYLPNGGGESHGGSRPVMYPACLFNKSGHSDRCAKTVWEFFPDNTHLRDNRGAMAYHLTKSLEKPTDFTVARCLTPARKAVAMRVAERTDATREYHATRGMDATTSPAPDRYYLHAETAITEDLHRWLSPARPPWDRLLGEIQAHDPAFNLPAQWRHVSPTVETATAADFLTDPDHVLYTAIRLLQWENSATVDEQSDKVPSDDIYDPKLLDRAAAALDRGGQLWSRAIRAMNRRNTIREEMRDRAEDAWTTMAQTSPTMAAPSWDLIRGQPGFEYRGPY